MPRPVIEDERIDNGASNASPSSSYEKSETKEDDATELEDLEEFEDDSNQKKTLATLQDKFLDRLAEVLARFKTAPNPGKGPNKDAKHVCATMLAISNDDSKVRLLCAKNEGLDEIDKVFLNEWKTCLEKVAMAGDATPQERNTLLDLIVLHQKPRTQFYVQKLQIAHEICQRIPIQSTHCPSPILTKNELDKQPFLQFREWEDDHGYRYQFRVDQSEGACERSDEAASAASAGDMDPGMDALAADIQQLSAFATPEEVDSSLLKRIMCSTYLVWSSVKTRASFKACLKRLFSNGQARAIAEKALLFLCRIHYSVEIFIETVEKVPAFRSIECVPVPDESFTRPHFASRNTTPLGFAKSLGIDCRRRELVDWLTLPKNSAAFDTLLGEKRHVHCEIQVLHFMDQATLSSTQRYKVHPYIGCSRLCCYLCYCFLLSYGGIRARGTHEVVMNKWEIPMHRPAGRYSSKVDFAAQRFFQFLKNELQSRLNCITTPSKVALRAQSSVGLSTAKSILEEEVAEMERSELERRSMMMMPMVMDDAIHIHPIPERPGFAAVMGGRHVGHKIVRLGEAENMYAENLRRVYGFERLGQMPQHRAKIRPMCRRCHLPGITNASRLLALDSKPDGLRSISEAEQEVLWLYTILCRDFNCLPDACDTEWFHFGFCFCRNVSERKSLRAAILALPSAGFSLEQITEAWKTDSLLSLMKDSGIDIAVLEAANIRPHAPELEDLGVYRLIAEVSHVVSGGFCLCYTATKPSCSPRFHLKHETHLSRESDADYAFHGANTWERWKLFEFYAQVFKHPHFDPQDMQKARQGPDPGALENYLDSLFPGFRMSLWNKYQADAMFPKLKSRLRFPNGRFPCFCFLHRTMRPDGLDSRTHLPRNWAEK
ncbi:hypothetical protein BCR34DRAFT_474885 [Clohesyomyces aquaticus]|uniref:Uncharacterized protein n=1 Tax=Clohesyomyces aquaticus TaxID=1231657 RepID=A0A1Y2A4T0_9PLEO|nr:hypothetical protein BCR34DRAFT_474885 [Clohesyomyces aquaticus]